MRLVFVRESGPDSSGDAMTTVLTADKPPAAGTIFRDGRPMSGDEYFALGETSPRVELLDGSLLVTPNPTVRHQRIARHLADALERNADAAHLQVEDAVNLRLDSDRIFIPDLVLFSADVEDTELFIEADTVALVCEILSPSNATTDKVLKMHCYAEAGIPWYLVIDPQGPTLHLYELAGSAYKKHSTTQAGEVLTLTEPVAVEIEPTRLLSRKR